MQRSWLDRVRDGRRLPVVLAVVAGAVLCLSGPPPVSAQATTRAASRIMGTVVDRQTGEPIAAARIVLLHQGTSTQLAAVASDAAGAFVLPPTAPGPYGLLVELLGYRTLRDSTAVVEGEDDVLTIYLVSEAIDLEPLVVRVPRTVAYYMRDFEERRATGSGTFINRAQIERRRGSRTSEILDALGGVRVQYGRQGEATLFVRGGCRPQVFVNGVATHQSVSVDLAVVAEDIEGIEVHSNATIPARYASAGACAAILIWTRPAVRGEGRKVSKWKLAIAGGVLLTLLLLGR